MGRKKKDDTRSPSVRMNISIPADLRQRMKTLEEKAAVNWSQLACDAYETKIAEQLGKEDEITLDDLISRVRSSKKQTTDQKYRQGVELGEKWATGYFGYEDFLRLDDFVTSRTEDDWKELANTKGSQKISARLLRTLDSGGTLSEAAKGNWMSDVPHVSEVGVQRGRSQDLRNSIPFLRGYCDGAMKIWSQIKKEI
ncbi:MAG TPA: hypothetical protein QF564_28270 [Pirellulaceae bacterium]|jgi:hypothetical protein|nr:hypothetical protein [Pirellulaceae bacterium]